MSKKKPMNRIEAPFTPDQVKSLNAFQQDGRMHEFTCNSGSCPTRTLVAHEEGWFCMGCPYRQSWAYDWMGDWSWKAMLDKMYKVGPLGFEPRT
jgi:hypothetical protein